MGHIIRKSKALPQMHDQQGPQFGRVATAGECENFLSMKFSPDV